MPVRVYDIAKKLGIENKEVIAKAKELGITAAKVPSSNLDKITAEYLENELAGGRPVSPAEPTPKAPAPSVKTPDPIQPATVPAQKTSAPPGPYPLLKPDNRFLSPRMLQIIQSKLQGQAAGRQYSALAFENDVNRLLNELFPFSVLPGIRLFSSEPRGQIDYGFEIDNLVHLRHKEIDYVIEVEVKHQPVTLDKGKWQVRYDGAPKCAREQLDNHIRTMWEYLRPIARQTELKFMGIVVSSDPRTERKDAVAYRNSELNLCSVNELPRFLAERFNFNGVSNSGTPEVLRVAQSGFLDLLRLSLPVEELGHPELASAIRYVDRCRRNLDETLFQKFEPTAKLWAINGSAGMGKSVLLAYSAAVLSSGFELYRFQGDVGVKKATETFANIGFKVEPRAGPVVIMAMSAKQLDNIRTWFSLFQEQFQQADLSGDVRFRQPEYLHCRPDGSLPGLVESCSALLVDEAHDIPFFAARAIADLHAKSGFYLVVACDRHQKLRLGGTDTKIIEGLDFTNRSTRLRQIYRNPAPVYIASLALMFRWFAESGPKVLPTTKDLQDQFGFEATSSAEGVDISIRSDAHPANSWCHTVATFPNAAAAYAALLKEKLQHRDVLWVRFSEEDPDFDYERLIHHFTYHNCRAHDAHKISDKYIKGQDYPVVVIEGFPGFMDRFEASSGETAAEAESRAWAFRRELYLCASRATTFLYFVCNVPETPDVLRIRNEIQKLVAATATPEKSHTGGTKSWKFLITRTDQIRKVDVFADVATPRTTQVSEELAVSAAEITQVPVLTSPAPPVAISNIPELPSVVPATVELLPETKTIQVPPHLVSQALDEAPVPMLDVNAPPVRPSPPRAPDQIASAQASSPGPTATKSATNRPPGEIALLSDVAQQLGRNVNEVTDQLRRRGFPNVTPSSLVNVRSIKEILKNSHSTTASPSQIPLQNVAPKTFSGTRPVLSVQRNITVQQLANQLGVKTHTVVAFLMGLKELRHANQSMSERALREVCDRCGFDVSIGDSAESRQAAS